MKQPPSYVAQWDYGLVCKICHSLYGLKQSPQAWFGKCSHIMQIFLLKWSEANHFIFYHHASLLEIPHRLEIRTIHCI